MKNPILSATVAAAAVVLAGSVGAIPLGTDITISDNNYVSDPNSWYGNHEDQETETNPYTVQGQMWDLEGMYMNGSNLSLVGGYDFKNGVTWSDGYTYRSGDVFIDTNSNAVYGQAANGGSGVGGTTHELFGYDYVMHLDFTTMTFDLVNLDAGSQVTLAKGLDVPSSNPWRYVSGGEAVTGYQGVSFNYLSGLSDADVGGLLGGSHYAISFDTSFLSSLGGDGTATFHNTMECGNDNLMGRTSVPDAASTASLLGLGLLGLVGLRRRLSVG